MFNFRYFTILFFLLILGLNMINIFMDKSNAGWIEANETFLYGLVLTTYFGVSFVMAFLACSNFHHPVICQGKSKDKVISITFDDGPDAVNTPQILQVLKKLDVKAAFFCIGKKLKGNETLITEMIRDGHVIGNHSYSHSWWFDFLLSGKIRKDLEETDKFIQTITGKTPAFFRPPYGVINPMVSNALKGQHWITVCWNIRSFDTMKQDHEKISGRILRQLQPGSILLLHDHSPYSASHLESLILRIKNMGYRFIPLPENLDKSAYV